MYTYKYSTTRVRTLSTGQGGYIHMYNVGTGMNISLSISSQ